MIEFVKSNDTVMACCLPREGECVQVQQDGTQVSYEVREVYSKDGVNYIVLRAIEHDTVETCEFEVVSPSSRQWG